MRKALLPLLLLLALPFYACAAEIPTLDKAGLDDILAKNKGKVIMLNFFATWCPPCRAEIPELVKTRKTFPEDKLLIVGLSVDEKADVLPPFIEKTGIDYPVFLADRSVSSAYNVTSVPHNAFIAPDGSLVISEPGMAEAKLLDQVVNDLAK